jgi:hypothetical protein
MDMVHAAGAVVEKRRLGDPWILRTAVARWRTGSLFGGGGRAMHAMRGAGTLWARFYSPFYFLLLFSAFRCFELLAHLPI